MNDTDLDQLLKAVGTPAMSLGSFQRDVWARIEAEESIGWKFFFNQALDRFLGFFAIPQVAVVACTAMVLAGGWLGLQSAKSNPPDEMAYVESISPFAQSDR